MANYDRTVQIKQVHEKRRQATLEKVEAAIKRLTKGCKDINFNSVSKEAGVSKATLYNNSKLRDRIDFLRNQQEKTFINNRIKRDENNQNAIIASLKRRIEKLEKKNKDLEEENRKLREEEKKEYTEFFNQL